MILGNRMKKNVTYIYINHVPSLFWRDLVVRLGDVGHEQEVMKRNGW